MPWIRGQAEFFRGLEGVDWRWHVVEGLAEHVQDTAWCREAGGRLPEGGKRKVESGKEPEPEKTNLSTDGTSEILDHLAGEFGRRLKIHRPDGGRPWHGKKAMIDAFLGSLEGECLLWQLDVDEFWRPHQVREIMAEFQKRPEVTAAWFDCDYFFGWDRCSSAPGVFGNFREFEWLRVWKYQPGDEWKSHEPPVLVRQVEGGRREDVGRIRPMRQTETRALGWKFQHYALTDRAQMEFKETYYGHRGLLAGLAGLGKAGRAEPLARRFFPPIRAKEIGSARTLRTFWKNLTGPFQPGARAADARKAGLLPIAQTNLREEVRFSFGKPGPYVPSSILLVRADRIGDQILFLPFLASLKKQLPQTQVHLAVPEDVAPIYRLWGELDRLHTFQRDEGHKSAGYRAAVLKGMPARFDWVILPAFNGEKLSHKLAAGVKAERRVSLAGEFRGLKARHRAKYEKIAGEKVRVPNPDLHELEKYRLLLRHLGLQEEINLPEIRVGGGDRPRSSERAQIFPRIVLAVGTVNPIKEYPHWPEAVETLNQEIGPVWTLIGGPGEKIPERLARVLPPEKTRDLRGKTDLEELAGEMATADLFLGVDTGPAHLALALGKPAVVVLGGGDYGRFFPYGRARVVTHRMECFQCHWDCRYERARCLHDLRPEEIVRQVLEACRSPA